MVSLQEAAEKLGIQEDRGLIADLADEISSSDHFAVGPGRTLYVYRNGVYVPNGALCVEKRVQALLTEQGRLKFWRSKLAMEVAYFLSLKAPELPERPPTDRLNVANGILDLDVLELSPPSPSFLSTIQLPVEFLPGATPSAWEDFAADCLPSDGQEQPFALAAWMMWPSKSIQKAALLFGPGGNGKSALTEALTQFIGRANVSTLTLHQIENDRFSVAHLHQRLANISADLPARELRDTSIFKSVVTGDPIHAEHKYERGFSFSPFCRLLFSSNAIPKLPAYLGNAPAFWDRWHVIHMTRTFRGATGEVRREELDARLADPRQLSGVLNRALELLPYIREHGLPPGGASHPSPSGVAAAPLDPLEAWIRRSLVPSAGSNVTYSTVLEACNRERVRDGHAEVKTKVFSGAVSRVYDGLSLRQTTISGERVRVYDGFSLQDGG